MVIILLVGLALFGYAFWLVLKAAGFRRARIDATLTAMRAYGFQGAAGPSVPDAAKGVPGAVNDLATRLGTVVASRTGLMREEELRRELRAAGMYTTPPLRFMGYRVLLGIGLPVFWLWIGVSGHSSPAKVILGLILAFLAGWQGPLLLVRRRARYRLEEIDYQMPELIDVLVTTVEGGVGFSGSLQMAAQRMHGPLGEELRLTLQEQDMGLSTDEALQHLVERADTPSVRTFVRAIVQGEQLGVSIGKIMRDLAIEMRKTRRQKAEERAQKAPTKMLFPLIFLIFPAMFVILLGPSIISIFHTLHGGV
jgi:tight adherence protein C